MNNIEIIPPGTKVKLKLANIQAFIISAVISEGEVLYKISYFWEGEMQAPLVYEFEFECVNNTCKKIIGFKI